MKKIPGAKPYFFNEEKSIANKIKRLLHSGNLSQGKYIGELEKKCSKFFNSKFAIAVNSGGTAIEICLEALDIKDKEVLVPTQTFIATANSVVRAGGIPVFCDIDPETGCIDIEDVKNKINKKTAGVIFVYMFGIIPKSVIDLKKLCKKKKIFLLEDAAHAHGGSFGKNIVGNIGDAACFSFYATKVLTSGEGGVITTCNKKIKDKCASIMNHGRNLHNPYFNYSGNNFRLTEIQAIIALSQLKYLRKIIKHRNKIADIYSKNLKNIYYFKQFTINKNSINTYWRYPLYISSQISRNKLQEMCEKKYGFRVTWMYEPLCHKQPVFKLKSKIKLSKAEKAIKRLINLPTHLFVKPTDAIRICKNLNEGCKNLYAKKRSIKSFSFR